LLSVTKSRSIGGGSIEACPRNLVMPNPGLLALGLSGNSFQARFGISLISYPLPLIPVFLLDIPLLQFIFSLVNFGLDFFFASMLSLDWINTDALPPWVDFRAPGLRKEGQVKGMFQWFGPVGLRLKGEKGDTPRTRGIGLLLS
jgi:hypothetical protein